VKRYLVVVEGGQNGENYAAYSPDVDGCVATGDTMEEVLRNMYEALEMHIGAMVRDGDELPEESVSAVYMMIPVKDSAPAPQGLPLPEVA
jgi:predicted RNase H-like HicB family nuclease